MRKLIKGREKYNPSYRYTRWVYGLYEIRRNPNGELTYRLVRDLQLGEADVLIKDEEHYAHGHWCAHNKKAASIDLAFAAGLDEDTPVSIVNEWWDEFLPVPDAIWQKRERKRIKDERTAARYEECAMADYLIGGV